MKKLLLAAIVMLALNMTGLAQSEKYVAAMQKNLAMSDSAFAQAPQLIALSNNFERIAVAEKSQWLPYYYAAFFLVNNGFMQGEDMSGGDVIAERAEKLLMKADSLSPKNSEISTLKSMIATLRMLVNPYQRYMQYGTIANSELQMAMDQDPANPRPYYLKGQTTKNTPANFGGGCDAAVKDLKMAKEKFASFTPTSAMAPNWGADRLDKLMKQCGLN